MNIIYIVGIVLIVLSVVLQKNKKLSPYWGFILVFLIMGFQEGIEGDFMGYKTTFNSIGVASASSVVGEAYEWGWYYLMLIFSIFPFWFFVMSLAGFQSFVLVKYAQTYERHEYQYLAPILFFFTFNMMLMQMKAMGQGAAIEMTMLAFLLVDKTKKPWWPAIIAFFAFTIHNSAVVMWPFLLLYYAVKKKGNSNSVLKIFDVRLLPYIMTGIYIFLFVIKQSFLGQYLTPLAFGMMEGSGLHYAGYLDEMNTAEGLTTFLDDSTTSPLIVAYDGVIVFLVSWLYRFANPHMRVLILMSIIAAIGDMMFFGLGSLYRIFMYFTVFNIIVYPALVKQIKVKYGGLAALALIVLLVAYAMKTSIPWMLETEAGRFGTYHFVFF